MKDILFLYPSGPLDVRLSEITKYLKSKSYTMDFCGWKRHDQETKPCQTSFEEIMYCLTTNPNSKIPTALWYLLYISKLFFKLRKLKKDYNLIYAVNFESALSCYVLKIFDKKVKYFYDIFDELALSHKFPKPIKAMLRIIDKKLRKEADCYIHVDPNRVSDLDNNNDNYVIIRNAPFDVLFGSTDMPIKKDKFAVTGWLNNTRGLTSIYEFAKNHPHIEFIVAGEFRDKAMEKKYLSLKNICYHHFMPQQDLFNIIKDCRGIFSLYDPSIEINKLAASNKLYDAMMLGIPVIVNNGIIAADFVNENGIGYVVEYDYNCTWDIISNFDENECNQIGQKGRKLYLNNYEFGKILEDKLVPRIASTTPPPHVRR